jgi:putative MFS transporter
MSLQVAIADRQTSVGTRLDYLPIGRIHRKLLFLHGFGWLFDALDVGIVTFVLAVLARDWKLTPSQIGLIGSASPAGMLIGAAFAGVIADHWGRKTVFQATLFIFCITTLLCGAAWNVSSLLTFRFLVGVGLGGELPVVASLLCEFIPAAKRGRYLVLLESFWAFGWLLAALVAFLLIPIYGWRWAFVVGALPAFYVAVIRRKLPESPRWLESKGRSKEAEAIVSEFETAAATATHVVPDGNIHRTNEASPPAKAHFSDLLNGEFRRRTIMLWLVWFGLTFGYYGIFVWLPILLVRSGFPIANSFLFVVFMTIAQIPGYFTAAAFIERYGRKVVLVVYLTISAIAAVFFGYSTSTIQLLIAGLIMSFFNLGAWGALYAYTPELYPTRIRATGHGAASAFGRIGGLLAPLTVGALLPGWGKEGVLALNSGFILLGAAAVLLLGFETKSKILEEIAK